MLNDLSKLKRDNALCSKQNILFAICFSILLALLALIQISISEQLDVGLVSIVFLFMVIAWLVLFEVVNLTSDKHRALLYNVILVLLIALFFVRDIASLSALLILALGCYECWRRFQKTRTLFTKFDYIAILKESIPVFLTALSLCVAILFTSLSIDETRDPSQPVSREMFDFVFVPLDSAIGAVSDNGLSNFVLETIGESGIEVTGEESLVDEVYTSINRRIAVETMHIEYVSLVVIVSLFLFLRLVSLLIMWVSFVLVFLVIKAFLFYNIISIKNKNVRQEWVNFG